MPLLREGHRPGSAGAREPVSKTVLPASTRRAQHLAVDPADPIAPGGDKHPAAILLDDGNLCAALEGEQLRGSLPRTAPDAQGLHGNRMSEARYRQRFQWTW